MDRLHADEEEDDEVAVSEEVRAFTCGKGG